MKRKNFYGYEKRNIYLDNAASTLALQPVVQKGMDFLSTYGSVHRGAGANSELSTNAYEGARRTIGEFIDASDSDCVIFTGNTTDAINKFNLLFDWKPGDEVLVSDIEHSSNWLPWEKSMKRCGGKVRMVPTENFQILPDAVEAMLEQYPQIRVVAVSASSNVTGYLTDMPEIYKVCKKYGVLLFGDYSQYAPHKRPSLKDCDVMAYCGHKMYAPFGCGVLAGRKEYLSHDNLSLTGGGNIHYVHADGTPVYKEAPFIHEAGTPNAIGAVTMAEAHRQLYDIIGEDALALHNEKMLKAMYSVIPDLEENGYKVYFSHGDDTIQRTPILLVNNQILSNAETTRLLNEPFDGFAFGAFDKHVFLREGAFCSYRVAEMLKPELKQESPIIDGKLNPKYSFLRLSAGLVNKPKDFRYAADKLIAINRNNEY